MDKNKFKVALTKEVCPVCGRAVDGPIIMNKVWSEIAAKEVEELDGKVVGVAEKPCEECQEHMKMGIKIVEIDEEKTKNNFKYPYRTGRSVVIKDTALDFISDEKLKKEVIKKRATFMGIPVFESLFGNLIKPNNNDQKRS